MKLYFIILVLFFSYWAQATPIPDASQFNTFIDNLDHVSAEYTQTKTIPNIDKKFTSVGHIKFNKQQGLFWHQTSPQELIFKTTQTHYCINEQTYPLTHFPHMANISEVIEAALSKNYTIMEKLFDITYHESKSSWLLTLTPKISDISKFIDKIVLLGNPSHLSQIDLTYTNKMTINLSFKIMEQELTDEIQCP